MTSCRDNMIQFVIMMGDHVFSDFFEDAIVSEFTLYVFVLFSCLDSDMLHVCFMLLHDLETQALNTIKEVVVVVFVVRAAAIAATVAAMAGVHL